MELKIFYVFGMIWVGIVDQDVYTDAVDQYLCAGTVVQWCCDDIDGWHFCWRVEVDLVHSDGGMYFKRLC